MANPTGIHATIIMLALIVSLAAISLGGLAMLFETLRSKGAPSAGRRSLLRFKKGRYLALAPLPSTGLETTSVLKVTTVADASSASVWTWNPRPSKGRTLPPFASTLDANDRSRRVFLGAWETTVAESPPLSLAVDKAGSLVVSPMDTLSVLMTDSTLPAGSAWMGHPRQVVAETLVPAAIVQGLSVLPPGALPTDALEWMPAPRPKSS